ncbi:hypothetical protein B6V73_16290 [Thioclava sp. JM3]|uniref:hypothetical protein n=1 Tax=unclassified Thioclava TaxID=2621713 RepID=UPI000B545A36|nr:MULTISPECIES: hypothetical protein [unclassified Thioclava]OWY06054.1 hypothetical protein B6V75_08170 [Thioclava sp. F1Mire-8]OWY14159.1 hypothetical protein B6V73_16290 [Thioclava sp. JM3]
MDWNVTAGMILMGVFAAAAFWIMMRERRYIKDVASLSAEDIRWFNSQPLSGDAYFGEKADEADDAGDDPSNGST